MSELVPKLDLVLSKAFDAEKDCVICGKLGTSDSLVSEEHGRQKVKQVLFIIRTTRFNFT